MEINEGEIVSLCGANAAGKSTMVRALSGIIKPWRGQVLFDGVRVDTLEPHEIVEWGSSRCRGRRIFSQMSVLENLLLGAYSPRARRDSKRRSEISLRCSPFSKKDKNSWPVSLWRGTADVRIGRG